MPLDRDEPAYSIHHPFAGRRTDSSQPIQPRDLRRSRPPRSTTSSRASGTTGSSSPWSSWPTADAEVYELVSGHRRLACARALGLTEVPCEVRALGARTARRRAVLEYNRQRRKTFSQMMREADAARGAALGRGAAEPARQPPPVSRARRGRALPSVGIPTVGKA